MYETMLIVDDTEMARDILHTLLEDLFTIMEAENGQECLDIVDACRNHIDVILLDLRMPVMDGFEVLERRQSIDYFRDIPVIVLTSSGEVEDQVRAFELGANDFISKPINVDLAVSRINNILVSRRRIMSLMRDTAEYRMKAELDQMTGLYNKTTSENIINDRLLEHAMSENALLIVDIDNFKLVNDTQGHQEGDHTLKIIADLLSSQFRKSDVIGRIGGDEFVVCMFDIPTREVAKTKARELVRLMKHKPNLSIPANVTLSIGLAFSDHQVLDYTTMFRRADEALYVSKNNGKAQYSEYGVAPLPVEQGNQPIMVICSNNRSYCNTIISTFEETFKMLAVETIPETGKLLTKESGIHFLIIDISLAQEVGENVWNDMKVPGGVLQLALCQEGDLEQYRFALANPQIADVITYPVERDALEKKISRLAKKIR